MILLLFTSVNYQTILLVNFEIVKCKYSERLQLFARVYSTLVYSQMKSIKP